MKSCYYKKCWTIEEKKTFFIVLMNLFFRFLQGEIYGIGQIHSKIA